MKILKGLGNIKMFKTNDATALSIPHDFGLHGIKIRKLPIGQYLKALDSIKNLPEILLKECFSGMDSCEIINKLKSLNEDSLIELAGTLIKTIPEQALKFIATLLGCSFEKLRDEVTPKELLDILKEFWKVNDMSDFFTDIKRMVMKENPAKELLNNLSMGTKAKIKK
jgi:hypothetical protein